jgi:hypothetical protein
MRVSAGLAVTLATGNGNNQFHRGKPRGMYPDKPISSNGVVKNPPRYGQRRYRGQPVVADRQLRLNVSQPRLETPALGFVWRESLRVQYGLVLLEKHRAGQHVFN